MAARKAAPDAQPPRLSGGFTLVEIAIGLGILALVLGALLPLFTAQASNARIATTRTHQDAIRTALITYLGRHGYLPCPADGWIGPATGGYGHEARTAVNPPVLPAGSCDLLSTGKTPTTSVTYNTAAANFSVPAVTIYRGVLPWLDLGLPEDVVNDGWNQRITYVVSSLAVTGYASREAISGMLGGLVVCNTYGGASALLLTPVSGAGNTPCTTPATAQPLVSALTPAVALISHGENGFGAFIPPQGAAATTASVKPWAGGLASASEVANIDLTQNALVQSGYSTNFDDVVLWLTPADLTSPLIQAGALPSVQALLSQRLNAASQAVMESINSAADTKAFQATNNGSTYGVYENYLCLPLYDAAGQALFFSRYSSTVGAQLSTTALPSGLSPANPPSAWLFSYEGGADIAAGQYARDPTKAGQLNYDPWGNPLLFTQAQPYAGTEQSVIVTASGLFLHPSTPLPIGAYAYILYSTGPDGLLKTDDDASLGVTVGTVQGALNRGGALAATPATAGAFSSPCPSISLSVGS